MSAILAAAPVQHSGGTSQLVIPIAAVAIACFLAAAFLRRRGK